MVFSVTATFGSEDFRFRCSVNSGTDGNNGHPKEFFKSVDVTIEPEDPTARWPCDFDIKPKISVSVGGAPQRFETGVDGVVELLLQGLSAVARTQHVALKLIIPLAQGHLVRADILELRLVDCPHVASLVSIPDTTRRFDGGKVTTGETPALSTFFAAAAGAVVVHDKDKSELETALMTLDLMATRCVIMRSDWSRLF